MGDDAVFSFSVGKLCEEQKRRMYSKGLESFKDNASD